MPGTLDVGTLRRAMDLFADSLRTHRDELDSLNVYPIPDGDTGTNMLLTQEAVVEALEGATGSDRDEVLEAISRASLMGARGNSGVILSQVLRGVCEHLQEGDPDAAGVAGALQRAADEAYRAVARPQEGTVLSVLRDAAAAARSVARSGTPGSARVVAAALDAARGSLARTREVLPELRRAGVVDAGGKGIVLLLDALHAALTGDPPTEPVGPLGPVGRGASLETEPGGLDFEVQYLLEVDDEAMADVRAALARVGDSVVVVGGSGLFNVHVHTNEPGSAVEVGIGAGRPKNVSITYLRNQVAACAGSLARAVQVAEPRTSALVSVADGDGLARTFRSLGAAVVRGGPGNDPSVGDLLAAVEAAPSDAVLVLPNHPNVTPAAERAAARSRKTVAVVPSRSVTSGIAAATVFNPELPLDENERSMKEAVEGCRSGDVVRAVRDADSPVGPVRRGDWLARVEGEVAAAAPTPRDAAVGLVRRLAGEEHEIVTLVVGDGADGPEREAVEIALRDSFPELEVEVVEGGQPHHPFLIGVE